MRPSALRVPCPTCAAVIAAPCLSPARKPLAFCHVERIDSREAEVRRERSRVRNVRRKASGKKRVRVNRPTISVSGAGYDAIKAEAEARNVSMAGVVEERIYRLVSSQPISQETP